MSALLDVNVLLALFDAGHVHHVRAKTWLLANSTSRWSTCPMTQNGFVRILSQASYPNRMSIQAASALLANATGTAYHEFWADDVSLLDPAAIDHAQLHGPKQVTDAYLLALAVRYGGSLLAFDRTIPLSAVVGATADHLIQL